MTYSPGKFSAVRYHTAFIPHKLKEFSELFSWANIKNFKMMDIGTGPGHLLREIETVIPQNYEEIIAVDREKDMLDYFTSVMKYPKISCRYLDIETKILPKDLKGRFDFLFSSYCLMYLQDFRQAFKNCEQLLKPNGELFFVWAKTCPPISIYKIMSSMERWRPYTRDFKDWHYEFDCDNVEEIVAEKLNMAGLKVLKTEMIENLVFKDISAEAFVGVLDSLDFLSKRIPQIDLPDYKKEYRRWLTNFYTIDENAQDELKVSYKLPTIIVGARKM